MTGTVDSTTLLKVDINIKVVLNNQHLSLTHFAALNLGGFHGMGAGSDCTAGINENYIQFVVLEVIVDVIGVAFLAGNNCCVDILIVTFWRQIFQLTSATGAFLETDISCLS